MSTMKFNPITIKASSITPFSTTNVSRLEIDCSMSRPSPGKTNTFSTTIAPAIRLANCSPMMVRMGVSACGAHEVLIQRLDDRRPCDARDDRRLHDAKRDRREDQRRDRSRRVMPTRKSARWNESQRHGEDENEQ